MKTAAVALLCLLPAPAWAQGVDSLAATAQRIAAAWQRHDFAGVVAAGSEVAIVLPGSPRSAPLAAAQAAEVLRGFVEGARDEEIRVSVVRTVGEDRAYVELDRSFAPRGTTGRDRHTVYLELRRSGAGFQVTEIRVVR